MLDVVVGIVIFLFVVLGLREGIFKSLGSVAAVFVSLFLATSVVAFLSKGSPQFGDPKYLGAIIVFLLVWAFSYLILDLLLTLLFKKIITVIVLGPVDKFGGLIIGGFKGLLICGIVLQLALAMPIAKTSSQAIKESFLSRYSIAIYHLAYPYAKKVAPMINNLMKNNLVDKAGEEAGLKQDGKELEKLTPEEFLGNVIKYEKVKKSQEEKIRKLLKEQKLLRGAPLRRIEDVK